MIELLVDVVCSAKENRSLSEEDFKREMESAVKVYTHSIEMSVLNRLRKVVYNKEIPEEIRDTVNNFCDSIGGSKSNYINNRSELVCAIGKELMFAKRNYSSMPSDNEVDAHYRSLALGVLNRIEPLIKNEANVEVNRLLDAFYFSIKGIENEMLSEQDIDDICHRVMMDINNTMLSED